MDTTGFFNYPTLPAPGPAAKRRPAAAHPPRGGAARATRRPPPRRTGTRCWTPRRRCASRPGEVVLRAGERDRAFYLLLDGQLEVDGTAATVAAPATLGVVAFLDGAPRAVTLVAAHARRGGAPELGGLRGARRARRRALGRAVLLDLAQGLGARLRAAGHAVAGWTG